ncbi:MAG: RDD family protein [Pseudomonadota bacterium]
MKATDQNQTTNTTLLRRVAAIVYDALLLVPLLMLTTLAVLALNKGQAIAPEALWFRLILLGISSSFFAWFWSHGGQTLGMRAWRLKLVSKKDGPVGIGQCYARFGFALISALVLGLGFLWSLFDKQRMTWHDHWSGTRIMQLPKES